VSRGFLLSFIALGVALAVVFAACPIWDLEVAQYFFDPASAKFPLSIDYNWNRVRRAANWVPFLFLLPAVFALLRKLVFPAERMLIVPSVVLYLLGSFLIGPGITSNLLLKENWGRPRPNGIQQFAGAASGIAPSYPGKRAKPSGPPHRQSSRRRKSGPWRLAQQSCSARRSGRCASCSGAIS